MPVPCWTQIQFTGYPAGPLQRTEALQVALRAGPGQPGAGGAGLAQAVLADEQAGQVNPQ